MKILIIFVLGLFVLSLAGCSASNSVTSEDIKVDCPSGLINDTYPGSCGQYIDQNNNGICDHSEPK